MDVYDLVRVANIAVSVGLLAVVNMRVVRDWPRWTRRERVVRVHLTAYLVIIAYGTVEALAQNVPLGVRVWLILACHLSFVAALWRTRNDSVR